MGNLGRPGYTSTGDGLWPYSFVLYDWNPVSDVLISLSDMIHVTLGLYRIKPTRLGSLLQPPQQEPARNSTITCPGSLDSASRMFLHDIALISKQLISAIQRLYLPRRRPSGTRYQKTDRPSCP